MQEDKPPSKCQIFHKKWFQKVHKNGPLIDQYQSRHTKIPDKSNIAGL